MPDQIEQLRIVVTLNDQATPGINNFQKSIQSFTSGQGAQQIESFKRQNSLMAQVLQATGLQATGAAKSFETLGYSVLGTAGVLGVFGIALYKATSMAAAAAKQVYDQANAFQRLGLTYAEGKNIVEQYERVGMSIDQAQENVAAGVQAAVEARRKGYSERFDGLRHQFGPEFVEQYRTQLANAKSAMDILNIEADYEQNRIPALVQRNRGARTDAQVKEDTARLQHIFRQTQGLNDQFSLAKQITALDKDREAQLNRMKERAEEFTKLWNTMKVDIERIGDILSSNAIVAFTPLLQSIQGFVHSIFQLMLEGHKALADKNFWKGILGQDLIDLGKQAVPPLKELQGSPDLYGGAFPIMGGAGFAAGGGDERLNDNTRELKKLNDNLYLMLHPQEGAIMMPGGGGGGSDGGAPAGPLSSSSTGPAPSVSMNATSTNVLGGGNFFDALTRNIKAGAFADGGIITGPTLALLGEGGRREAIVPLDGPESSKGGGIGVMNEINIITQKRSRMSAGLASFSNSIGDFSYNAGALGQVLRGSRSHRVQANGNVTVDVGAGAGDAPSPAVLSDQLFKPVSGGKQLQMLPASVGPAELAREGPGGRF